MTITECSTSYRKAGAKYGLSLSETEANINRRVIECRKKNTRGFPCASTALFVLWGPVAQFVLDFVVFFMPDAV